MWSPAVLCLSTDELGPLLCIVPASTELLQLGKDLWLQSLLVSPCAPRALSPHGLVQWEQMPADEMWENSGAGFYAPILPISPIPKGPLSPLHPDRVICEEFSFCTQPVMHRGCVLTSGERARGTAAAWSSLEAVAAAGSSCWHFLAVGLNCCLTAGKVAQTLCCH